MKKWNADDADPCGIADFRGLLKISVQIRAAKHPLHPRANS